MISSVLTRSIAIARLRLVEAERGLARRAEIAATLTGTQRRLKGLSTQLAEGTISETAFEAARRHLEADRSELEDELARLDSALFQEDFEKPV